MFKHKDGYDVVKASSHEEARNKSKFFLGQVATVVHLHTTANSDGTYCVVPEFLMRERTDNAVKD